MWTCGISLSSLTYLFENVLDYAGAPDYADTLAIRDRHVITASGLGAIEFTMEIFDELDIASTEARATWYDAFKHGKFPKKMPAEIEKRDTP